MWKWIVGGVLALVVAAGATAFYLSDKIYPRFDHATVAAADFDKIFSPAQLRQDFRALTATVEHIHPDVAAITDAKNYPLLKAQTLARLDHPMTRAGFFRIVAPFVGRAYRDGHTEILPLQEEWDAYNEKGGTVPPFAIRIGGSRILIAQATGVAIPPNAELQSLNGVDSATLRAWLIDTQSSEAMSGREAYAAKRFAERVWSFGLRPPFTIAWHTPGSTAAQIVTAKGIPADRARRMFSLGNGEPIHLSIAGGVAYLAIRNFEMPWDRYSAWLHDAFQKIRDAKVRAVILDLRENNGGDTRQSDALQTYLSVRQLPALQEVSVHATPEVKAMYRTLLPEGFRWIPLNDAIPMLRGIQVAPDNGTYTFHPEADAPTARGTANDFVYTGDLYVLISPVTYSTALIAAAPYKYWKRATLIGETTSEPMTFFGDNYQFDLPNTKLAMDVSHKLFKLFGSKGPHAGLEPDIAVTPGQPDARAIAIDAIARTSR